MSKAATSLPGPGGLPSAYPALLADIKTRIRSAQVRAALAANAELVLLYRDIGRVIAERQKEAGWGAGFIPQLARDIRNELPEVKGFSARNIGYMVRFYREYRAVPIVQQPAAQLSGGEASGDTDDITSGRQMGYDAGLILQQAAAKLPWFHHVLLMERVKDIPIRFWYMREALAQGWSRSVLAAMIDSRAHERQAGAVTNFDRVLPPVQSDLARQALKDPYIFDFLTLEEPFHERKLETGLLRHLEKFLIELGQGFAFVGRQYRVEVGEDDFYIDLLFYHLRLRCFVVIDLKKGPFKAEYAGKMNFYCNVVDDRLRHESDQPTVGLILCQDRNRLVAEYALKGMEKAIGVSAYKLTRALPKSLRSSLPSVQEIERELAGLAVRRARKSGKQHYPKQEAP